MGRSRGTAHASAQILRNGAQLHKIGIISLQFISSAQRKPEVRGRLEHNLLALRGCDQLYSSRVASPIADSLRPSHVMRARFIQVPLCPLIKEWQGSKRGALWVIRQHLLGTCVPHARDSPTPHLPMATIDHRSRSRIRAACQPVLNEILNRVVSSKDSSHSI